MFDILLVATNRIEFTCEKASGSFHMLLLYRGLTRVMPCQTIIVIDHLALPRIHHEEAIYLYIPKYMFFDRKQPILI